MRQLSEWQRIIYKNNQVKGFYDEPQADNIDRKLILAIGEISEAHEELRAGHDPQEIYFNPDSLKPEGFPIEIADAVIRLLDLCEHQGVDLEYAMQLKHDYNVTRSFKHGKAF